MPDNHMVHFGTGSRYRSNINNVMRGPDKGVYPKQIGEERELFFYNPLWWLKQYICP